jgi:hypothetical protein
MMKFKNIAPQPPAGNGFFPDMIPGLIHIEPSFF